MKNRIHFLIAGGVLLIAFIFGSIYDLAISNALYQQSFGFGIAVSAFSLILGYAVLAFLGGILLTITLKSDQKTLLKVFLIAISIGCYGTAVYFSGKEFFSVNGFNKPGIGWTALAMSICAVIHGAFGYLGYLVSFKNKNSNLWIVILILLAAIFVALVPGTTLLKSIFHRPRYRTVILGIEGVTYHNWWEPFKNYHLFISDTVTKEEFKSFPSGHAAASMVLCLGLATLPIFVPSLKKYQTALFYTGFAYSLLVSFTRILVGAHFLSDVAMGSILTMACFVIANEIIIRKQLIE